MTDFFDWLAAFDAGAATDRLASQHRLSPAEMRRTADALVPAFMLGLRPVMADPGAWNGFMRQVAAAGPMGMDAAQLRRGGEAVLAALFGPEMTGAVARQASLLTGQSPDAVTQLMPPLASLTLQSLLAMANEAGKPDGAGLPGDSAGRILAETMRRSANAVEAFNRPSARGAPASGPRTLQDLFSGALTSALPWPTPFGFPSWPPADPFGFFAAMNAGGSRPSAPPPPQPAAPPPAPAPQEDPPFLKMMASAQSLQADYMRAMLALFEKRDGPTP